MLGKIYKSLGLLSKGHVYEVGRVDLVGEYIGQTAPKVQKAIEKARGGILFIDEAYALSDRGDDSKDFGKEVIEVLIKEMSDGKGDIAFIFAGYPKEMQGFLSRNPGMNSRIQSTITFPDYVPDELMQIVNFAAQKRDISFTEEAREFLHKKIVESYRNRNAHFGNARFINGVVEECKQNMALRLMRLGSKINDLEKHELSEVILEDVEKAFGISNKADVYIPIDDALLREALAELHELVGLEEVKRDVDEIAKLVRYYTEIGRNVKQAFSLHTVFTGNPGTGKTTVARIMVKIYKALGVLERGHLVETDRKGLVAGYVGQTALKTDEIIQSAMGGGLFIDEAYALSEAGAEHNFGREAIDTLLKRMEDFRGQFMVIVAGYPEEMKKFLEANPGLLSRFDRTLHFADYTEEQLFQITEDMLEQENLYADDQAKQLIRSYIQKLLAHKHRYFGNARTIRKFTKEVARRQNLRLAAMAADQRTHEMVKTVCIEDIEGIKLLEQEEGPKQSSIGFKA
jgi:SpoVK/Ycf46/Vps4 family AAA+-type ATPase